MSEVDPAAPPVGVFDLKTMIAMIDDEMNDMLAVITAHVMLIFHILVRFIMICSWDYLLFVWTLRTICYLFGLVRSIASGLYDSVH